MTHEVDGPEPQLLLLDDVEVHADRGLGDRLDLEADLGEVVALGLVERPDALPVLEEQWIVESGPGGEGQDVANPVALDVLVARDRDLPDDRILFDVERQDLPLGRRLGEHAHVPEEPESMHLTDVATDLYRVVAIARPRRDPRADGRLLDAAVAPHADLGDAIACADARRRERGIGQQDLEANRDAVVAALRLGLDGDDRGVGAQAREILAQVAR
jgi:hypothetical protein